MKQKFTIIVPSYNNAKWYEKNLNSICNQKYDNFNIIYIDDMSPDNTGEFVNNYINKNKINNIKLIKNNKRKGALHNLYDSIHSCDDREIIVTVDGDDWLAHDNVLNILNEKYQDENVWMTWGSYVDYPGMTRGCAKPFPENIIKSNSYHKYTWCMSHLRTFYAALFKKIKKEDLYFNGKFAEMGWDVIFQLKQAQMAAGRFLYINDILYHYNNTNPIQDHKINQKLQGTVDYYARRQAPYKKLEKLF